MARIPHFEASRLSERPTLSEATNALRLAHIALARITREDVLRAAQKRNVPVVENRVERTRLADLFFALIKEV